MDLARLLAQTNGTKQPAATHSQWPWKLWHPGHRPLPHTCPGSGASIPSLPSATAGKKERREAHLPGSRQTSISALLPSTSAGRDVGARGVTSSSVSSCKQAASSQAQSPTTKGQAHIADALTSFATTEPSRGRNYATQAQQFWTEALSWTEVRNEAHMSPSFLEMHCKQALDTHWLGLLHYPAHVET